MSSRQNSWKRKDVEAPEGKGNVKNNEEVQGKVVVAQDQDPMKSRWEGTQGKQENRQQAWGAKGVDTSTGASSAEGNTQHGAPHLYSSSGQRPICEKCGMHNHNTQECRRL